MDCCSPARVLRPGAPGDPDATRAAAIIDAYIAADAARELRQRVWHYTLIVALLGLVLGLTTNVFAPHGLMHGLAALGGLASAAAVWEWHTSRNVSRLLAS
jgi:hypothetical protein